MFCCSHDVPPKTPEGKRGCSRIASPSHNEGTISNAEVASADASPPWLSFNFCFFETKIKEKDFCTAVDILKFFHRGYPNAISSNVCSCAEVISCGAMDNLRQSPCSLRRLRGNNMATAKHNRFLLFLMACH